MIHAAAAVITRRPVGARSARGTSTRYGWPNRGTKLELHAGFCVPDCNLINLSRRHRNTHLTANESPDVRPTRFENGDVLQLTADSANGHDASFEKAVVICGDPEILTPKLRESDAERVVGRHSTIQHVTGRDLRISVRQHRGRRWSHRHGGWSGEAAEWLGATPIACRSQQSEKHSTSQQCSHGCPPSLVAFNMRTGAWKVLGKFRGLSGFYL